MKTKEDKLICEMYNCLDEKETFSFFKSTVGFYPKYNDREAFGKLEELGFIRLKTIGGAFCLTEEGFNYAKNIVK